MLIETLLLQWIHKYKAGGNKNEFYKTFESKGIVNLIYYVFEHQPEHELLGPVCRQLYEQYNGICQELRLQSIHLIPSMVLLYLESYTDQIVHSSVEAFIMGVYNLDCVDNDGAIRHEVITIPDPNLNSIYHNGVFSSSGLPLFKEDPIKIELGFKCCKRMDNTNRFQVLSRVLNIFNRNISSADLRCKTQYCRIARRFVSRGFDNEYDEQARKREKGIQLRFLLKPVFLLEVIDGLYFVLFNGQSKESHQTFVAILRRAKYELFPTVIMVTIAILEDLARSKRKNQKQKPMVTSKIINRFITNASFRSKKLPEDITVTIKDEPVVNPRNLTSRSPQPHHPTANDHQNYGDDVGVDVKINAMDESAEMYMDSITESHEPYSKRPYTGHDRDVAQEGVATAALAAASLLPTEQILANKHRLTAKGDLSGKPKVSQSKKQQFKSVIRAPFKRGAHMFALAARSVKPLHLSSVVNSSPRRQTSNSTPAAATATTTATTANTATKSPYHSRHRHLLQSPSSLQQHYSDAMNLAGSGYNKTLDIPSLDNIPILQESNQMSEYRTTGKEITPSMLLVTTEKKTKPKTPKKSFLKSFFQKNKKNEES